MFNNILLAGFVVVLHINKPVSAVQHILDLWHDCWVHFYIIPASLAPSPFLYHYFPKLTAQRKENLPSTAKQYNQKIVIRQNYSAQQMKTLPTGKPKPSDPKRADKSITGDQLASAPQRREYLTSRAICILLNRMSIWWKLHCLLMSTSLMPSSMNTPQSQPLFCCGYSLQTRRWKGLAQNHSANLRASLKICCSRQQSSRCWMLSQMMRMPLMNCAKYQWFLRLMGMMRVWVLLMLFLLSTRWIILSCLDREVVAKKLFRMRWLLSAVYCFYSSYRQMFIISSFSQRPWQTHCIDLYVSFSTDQRPVLHTYALPRRQSAQIPRISMQSASLMSGQFSLSRVYFNSRCSVISALYCLCSSDSWLTPFVSALTPISLPTRR